MKSRLEVQPRSTGTVRKRCAAIGFFHRPDCVTAGTLCIERRPKTEARISQIEVLPEPGSPEKTVRKFCVRRMKKLRIVFLS